MPHMPTTEQPVSAASVQSTIALVNDEATTVAIGSPVYCDASTGFRKARANAAATGPVLGLLTTDVLSAATGLVQFGGAITLTTAQWDAVAGTSGGLAFNVPYYLSAATAGKLTATPPSAAGQVVQQVLIGVSPTQAIMSLEVPEVVGAGNNLIQLTNDAVTAMLIGEPVYSDTAGGMNRGIANGTGKSGVLGLVADATIGAAARGNVAVGGLLVATTTQWDAVAGTIGGLVFNTAYYLHPTTPGRLTATAPVASGQEVVQVITALSTTEARIAIQPAILL